jgi:EmrB/QacA subfamily drug resistance transporter
MNNPANPALANEKSLKLLLWLVAIGFFMQTLDSTIVNTALPAMASSLGESPLRMQSVVVAYSLTMAVLIPASGWLADRFGTRQIFCSAIFLFTLGSLFCAMSTTLTQLIASRVVQGAGGAMLLPVGRLSVLRSVPRERFLQAMSFVAIPGLVGPLIGPTLGGWLVEAANWNWIFLINVPVGIIGCIATLRYMPDSRETVVAPFDIKGFLLLSFGMAAVSLALDGMSGGGLRHASVQVLLIFGLASLTAYWLHATRRPHPLFSPQLFKVGTFAIGLLGNLFARIGSGSMPFLIPLLLQLNLGYSPARAGMMMLPVAAAGMLCKRLVTVWITHWGYRKVLVTNTMLVGLAIASFGLMTANQPIWLHMLQLGLFGAFNSMQFTAMNTLTLKDLEHDNASSGNSMLSMVQMLAMSLGVTVAGALLAAFTSVFVQNTSNTLSAFHATFACVGVITWASAWIFWQLAPEVNRPGASQQPAALE